MTRLARPVRHGAPTTRGRAEPDRCAYLAEVPPLRADHLDVEPEQPEQRPSPRRHRAAGDRVAALARLEVERSKQRQKPCMRLVLAAAGDGHPTDVDHASRWWHSDPPRVLGRQRSRWQDEPAGRDRRVAGPADDMRGRGVVPVDVTAVGRFPTALLARPPAQRERGSTFGVARRHREPVWRASQYLAGKRVERVRARARRHVLIVGRVGRERKVAGHAAAQP